MNFNEYQEAAMRTAEYPFINVVASDNSLVENEADYIYPTLGLVGEAGEVAEKIKKIVRNKLGKFDDADVKEIAKELGDVLWYIAAISDVFGLEMNDIAATNLKKLADRKDRGVIKSEGDNR